MTAPVTADSLVQGAAIYLLAIPEVVAVLGVTPEGSPWLFQNSLKVNVEGTSGNAAVISYGGGWSGGNEHNTLNFPRLSVELWVDPIRDADKNVTDPDESFRRLDAVYKVFDRVLHRAQGGTQMWGAVRTLSSLRQSEPLMYAVPDGDGLLRGQVYYAVEEG